MKRALLVASLLALASCSSAEAQPVAQFLYPRSFPDAGVTCWVLLGSHNVALSCLKTGGAP